MDKPPRAKDGFGPAGGKPVAPGLAVAARRKARGRNVGAD